MRAISNGPNSRPLDESLAETGPGIPDEAVGPGELGPGDIAPDAEAQAEALRRKGWVGSRAKAGGKGRAGPP